MSKRNIKTLHLTGNEATGDHKKNKICHICLFFIYNRYFNLSLNWLAYFLFKRFDSAFPAIEMSNMSSRKKVGYSPLSRGIIIILNQSVYVLTSHSHTLFQRTSSVICGVVRYNIHTRCASATKANSATRFHSTLYTHSMFRPIRYWFRYDTYDILSNVFELVYFLCGGVEEHVAVCCGAHTVDLLRSSSAKSSRLCMC